MHISSKPLARRPLPSRTPPEILRSIGQYRYSVMTGPIDLKFSGGILGIVGFLASGLLKICLIHFKEVVLLECLLFLSFGNVAQQVTIHISDGI